MAQCRCVPNSYLRVAVSCLMTLNIWKNSIFSSTLILNWHRWRSQRSNRLSMCQWRGSTLIWMKRREHCSTRRTLWHGKSCGRSLRGKDSRILRKRLSKWVLCAWRSLDARCVRWCHPANTTTTPSKYCSAPRNCFTKMIIRKLFHQVSVRSSCHP